MKTAAVLLLSLGGLSSAHAQSPDELASRRAAEARQLQDGDAIVHAQHAADAPKREALRRWHQSHRPWRVLVFHAFRPGILSMCENAHRWPDFQRLAMPDTADPLKARWLTEALSLQWRGGSVSQPARGDEAGSPPRLLTDACFTLFVDDAPVLSGAVVPSYSARRFDFPALIVEGGPAKTPLVLTLSPRFPAGADAPLPAGWAEWLKNLR